MKCIKITRHIIAILAIFFNVNKVAAQVYESTKPQSAQSAKNNAIAETSGQLVILSTTDIHGTIYPYDYYQDKQDTSKSLAQVATLIQEERKESTHVLLFDSGDLLQGTPLTDTFYKSWLKNKSLTAPNVTLLEFLGYDAFAPGNHDFDYGLEFLKSQKKNSKVPFITSNTKVSSANQPATLDKTLFDSTVIVTKNINSKSVSIGLIGLAPTQIMQWNKDKVAGKINVIDLVESASMWVSYLKNVKKVDLIVVISHSGINPLPYEKNFENAVYHLTKIKGIDAIVAGHQHQEFPSEKFAKQDDLNINIIDGTINKIPVVMPGSQGSHLGKIVLDLKLEGKNWLVSQAKSELIPAKNVVPNEKIIQKIKNIHEQTLADSRTEIAYTKHDIHTFFSRLSRSAAIDLINEAQLQYVTQKLAKSKDSTLPIISAAAPLRSGFKGEFTFIKNGPIALKNVADLYVYPNTIKAIKVKGSDLKKWLERAGENFSNIDKNLESPQNLLNPTFAGYNFDTFLGIDYVFDLNFPAGDRIKSIKYQNKIVHADDEFIVATNNYRAGGGGGYGFLANLPSVLEGSEDIKTILSAYLNSKKTLNIEPYWEALFLEPKGTKVFFETSKQALVHLKNLPLKEVSLVKTDSLTPPVTESVTFQIVPNP